jgi:hypothetical protein
VIGGSPDLPSVFFYGFAIFGLEEFSFHKNLSILLAKPRNIAKLSHAKEWSPLYSCEG